MVQIYQGTYRISSPFGNRTLENGDPRFHKGIDYVGISNKNLVAVADGTVKSSQIIVNKANGTWEYGNYVIIDDGFGYNYRYCHLSKRLVSVGMNVKVGQVIGVEGNTGYSFGSHCHFEVRRNSDNVSIDPNEYFKILELRNGITIEKALDILQENGIMNSKDYWISQMKKDQYLDDLLINMAKYIQKQ